MRTLMIDGDLCVFCTCPEELAAARDQCWRYAFEWDFDNLLIFLHGRFVNSTPRWGLLKVYEEWRLRTY